MAAPLLAIQVDADPRAFALFDCAAKRPDQRLDVGEHDRGRSWSSKDRLQCFALFGVHSNMISKIDIKTP